MQMQCCETSDRQAVPPHTRAQRDSTPRPCVRVRPLIGFGPTLVLSAPLPSDSPALVRPMSLRSALSALRAGLGRGRARALFLALTQLCGAWSHLQRRLAAPLCRRASSRVSGLWRAWRLEPQSRVLCFWRPRPGLEAPPDLFSDPSSDSTHGLSPNFGCQCRSGASAVPVQQQVRQCESDTCITTDYKCPRRQWSRARAPPRGPRR